MDLYLKEHLKNNLILSKKKLLVTIFSKKISNLLVIQLAILKEKITSIN